MKKTFLSYLLGVISLVVLFSSAYAHDPRSGKPQKEVPLPKYVFDEMKAEEAILITRIEDVSARALKHFSKAFKASANASWYETKEGGFIAKFNLDGIDTKVYYDRKGNWKGTLRNYMEENLPQEIRHQVKSSYYDFTIYLVQEVTVDETTAYLVKIEDATTLKTIRVIDGVMDEYESFKKAK